MIKDHLATYAIYQVKKRSFIHLSALSTNIFRPPRRAISRRADSLVESLPWYAYIRANTSFTCAYVLACTRVCVHAFMSEWAHMHAGCGPPARLHYVYVVYDVRRPPQICGRISPRRDAWVWFRTWDFHRRRIFPQEWFYCPWTRASCWNSKWSSRRDVTPSICEGSVKGKRKEVAQRFPSRRLEKYHRYRQTAVILYVAMINGD